MSPAAGLAASIRAETGLAALVVAVGQDVVVEVVVLATGCRDLLPGRHTLWDVEDWPWTKQRIGLIKE